jgi:two-component sensor histidine kinase
MSEPNDFTVSKIADIQLLLFKLDSAAGNYQIAIKHFQQYKTLTDSIFNEKKSRQIEQLQVEYKTEKKDQEIKLLTKKDQLQQANLRQASIIRNWITASAVLLILLLIVGFNRYRFKQRTNKKLEAQQEVINQKNNSLQHLVNEKEWLIKEIHHRVKNNFHIVMGLLGTQSGYLKNEDAIAAIKESQQRIHAMSLIHLKLYQSENLSSIYMPGYIYELVDSLKESFDRNVSIQFHLQVDRINMELSHAIPIGLILNEAITNGFKYAFPNKKEGNIYISFTHNRDDNRIALTVMDDGTGLPADFNINSQSSMGLNLMKGLSEDIDGSFSMQSSNGTIVTVSFIYNPDQSDFVPL